LGHYRGLGWIFGLAVIVGLTLAWLGDRGTTSSREVRRRLAEPTALLVGGVVLQIVTANARWLFGSGASLSSRYLHAGAVFALPALAVAVDAIARRWSWRGAAPLGAALLLLPIPGNIQVFKPDPVFSEAYFRHARTIYAGIASSPLARQVPPDDHPLREVFGGPGPSVGWLVQAFDDGRIPDPRPLTLTAEDEVRMRVGIAQLSGPASPADLEGRACSRRSEPLELTPKIGTSVVLRSTVRVEFRDGALPGPPPAANYFTLSGEVLRFVLDDLPLTFRPSRGETTFELCT
jgi:hypothetical protein